MKVDIIPHKLVFKVPGGTSRGVLNTKDTWFIKIENGENVGWGEVAMFRGLSSDDRQGFENQLKQLKEDIEKYKPEEDIINGLLNWPSIRFGAEQALLSIKQQHPFTLFPTDFVHHKSPIPINGLVWMGDYGYMEQQIQEKLANGFDCIKLKIGAINFDEELRLIKRIRNDYDQQTIEIRVDANGAFTPQEAFEKLQSLASMGVHSIEQPIKQGQATEMSRLCNTPPIDIALDEELIGVNEFHEKIALLDRIQPQYIILKPSLLGGFKSCDEWIDIAENLGIGWWITSALESNIGLNAIAQYVSTKEIQLPQGLGTGSLFLNNIPSPLTVENGSLFYDNSVGWDTSNLDARV